MYVLVLVAMLDITNSDHTTVPDMDSGINQGHHGQIQGQVQGGAGLDHHL